MKQRAREDIQLKRKTKAQCDQALWDAHVKGQDQQEAAERQGSSDDYGDYEDYGEDEEDE